MTNAKSRLVRVIALALAVLMIVPMALVGCKKTDDTPAVDQAAIDAAIKEALDAAQKAQDAADKAAQDAKDAQDKLAASEKEAADLQAQIDAMKNTTTTAAPATTTQAPVAEDTTVVDAYIASVVLDPESDFNKLVDLYVAADKDGKIIGIAKTYLGADTNPVSADAKVIADTIATAKIAIQRAQTVDYVNALIAKLAADLDAVPTISERVKAAYDAIDFASDEDIVDVAYANKLLAAAKELVDKDITKVTEIDEFVEAEEKALTAFGADELDLDELITDEYVRYTDANDGLYGKIFAYAETANTADTGLISLVRKLFALKDGEFVLDVKNIVYGDAANKEVIEQIEKLYNEFYKLYKKDYAALQDAFEIAVIGADYLLVAEGNYIREQLKAADARIAELEAAAKEFKETKTLNSASNGIVAMVNAFKAGYGDKATGEDFIFNKKTNEKIVAIDAALNTWMKNYGFDAEDDNLDSIIAKDIYADFAKVKAVMNFVNAWAAKLDAVDEDAIDDAIKALKDDDKCIDYAEQGAAVKALYAWYYGTYKIVKKDKTETPESNKDGVIVGKEKASFEYKKETIYLDQANIDFMLKDALSIDTAAVETLKKAIEDFEGINLLGKDAAGKAAIIARVKDIEDDADELNLAELKVEDLDAIKAIEKKIEDLCGILGLKKDKDADFGWDVESKNYGVVPFDTLAAIYDAKDALLGDILDKAAEIVKAYIGWQGTYDEGEEAVKYGDNYYEVEVVDIDAFAYPLVSKLAADYDVIKVFDLSDKLVLEDIDENEITFTTEQVVEFYRAINDEFYYKHMEAIHNVAYGVLRVSTILNNDIGANKNPKNEWMHYNAEGTTVASSEILAKYDKAYAEFGLKYVFPTKSAEKGTGDAINVYATVEKVGADKDGNDVYKYIHAVEAVDATKYVVKNADGLVIGFDTAAYKAAVDASIASYRATWYANYLAKSGNDGTINPIYEAVIKNAIEHKLWTIEGEFEMNDVDYTFVVNSDWTVTVLDGDDEIALVPGVVEVSDVETNVEYKISADFKNNKVVILAAKLVTAAVADNPNTTDVDETAPAVFADAVKLAEVDDNIASDAPKYEYALADGMAEIIASSKTIGSIKKANDKANGYILYSDKLLTALNEAFETNQFYVYRDALVKGIDSLIGVKTYNDDGTVKSETVMFKETNDVDDEFMLNLIKEFKGDWKNAKHTNATYEDIDSAYAKFIAQINVILAKYDLEVEIAK